MTDGIVRRTKPHSVKRMAALAALLCFAPLAAACSTSGSSAQPPLYLTNEGAYPYDGAARPSDTSNEAADIATPVSATSGWGSYSGARGQITPPAPVSNVYRGRNSY